MHKGRNLRLAKEQVKLTRKIECWLGNELLTMCYTVGSSSEHERIDNLVSRIVVNIPSHNITLWKIERRP